MPRHSCRGALFWSFRYGYATLLESWRHSLPHVQPADPAGRRCRVAVLPPAAQSPGRKPRPDRASLSLWGSGGIGRRKISLPAAPAAPAAPGPPPVGGRSGRLFRPLPLGWVRLLWRAVRRSGRGLAVLPAAQGPLFPTGGRPGPRRPPVPHLWPGGLLPGRVLLRHSRPRRLAGGDLSGLSRGPQRRGAPPRPAV